MGCLICTTFALPSPVLSFSASNQLHLKWWCQPAYILLQTSSKSAPNLLSIYLSSLLRSSASNLLCIYFESVPTCSKWVVCLDHPRSSKHILTTNKISEREVGGDWVHKFILISYMFITSIYDILFNIDSSLRKKEKKCDERTDERTDRRTDRWQCHFLSCSSQLKIH